MSHRTPEASQVPALELKILLRLLQFPDYRTTITQLRPNTKTTPTERDCLCRQLHQKGLVDCEDKITRFGLTVAGRTLLTLDVSILPVTPDERLVLKSCKGRSISPGQIHRHVPKNQRQRLLAGLAERGLIRVIKRQIGAVWMTHEGQRFLREDCAPQGHTPVLSWTLMSSYLQFMRQNASPLESDNFVADLTPDDLLQIITHLDTMLNTENYLPICHLREKLQPPLLRHELDQQLYQLQREDRIDLSTLQDVAQYSREEVAAGIPQDIGGPLFFISVV
ncbi:MAG: hypothetical protein AAFY20_08240 [Cyanobacteria bacterium J06639_14]